MTNIEIAAIAPFEDDLNKMTIGEMQSALQFVREEIECCRKWEDALVACIAIGSPA